MPATLLSVRSRRLPNCDAFIEVFAFRALWSFLSMQAVPEIIFVESVEDLERVRR